MAVGEHGADLDDETVFKAGVRVGDGEGFVDSADAEFYIATHGFLGLGKRAVHDAFMGGAGDNVDLRFEGLALRGFALFEETFEPRVPAGDELLTLLRGEVLVVFRAGVPEEKYVRLGFHDTTTSQVGWSGHEFGERVTFLSGTSGIVR